MRALAHRLPASIARISWCAAALGPLGGCLLVQQVPQTPPGSSGAVDAASLNQRPQGKLTVEQLQEMVQGFADRYYTLITGACDELLRTAPNAQERLLIDRFQSRTIAAVYDIATNEDPFTQLLDLTVVVTLTSTVVIDEGMAEEAFGDERAESLVQPMRRAREEIWRIASAALTPQQLETLDSLIVGWRRDNPDIDLVSFVRFDDFASSRGKSTIADVRTGTGFLAPVDEVRKEANEARLFGERVFYMAKRAPLLVAAESSMLLNQVASMPELHQALDAADRLAESADRISATAAALPDRLSAERDAITSSVERTSGSVRETLAQYEQAIGRTEALVGGIERLAGSTREVVGSLDSTAESLTRTIEAADRLAARFATPPDAPPAQPTDPEVYARLVSDLRGGLVELNQALVSARSLADDPIWERPLAAADQVAQARIDQSLREARGLVDAMFLRAIALVAVCFGLLFVYRGWTMWMTRSGTRRSVAS